MTLAELKQTIKDLENDGWYDADVIIVESEPYWTLVWDIQRQIKEKRIKMETELVSRVWRYEINKSPN